MLALRDEIVVLPLRLATLSPLPLIATIALSTLVSSTRGADAIAVEEENGQVRVHRKWVRFEVWDVAANGAFTQPVWLAPQ